jgi:hypothetical protein
MNEVMLLYRVLDKSTPAVHTRRTEPEPLQYITAAAGQ